jgi:gluconokinase
VSSIVIMGVAGCGKSSLAALLAKAESSTLIEGDDHHSAASRAKMAAGVALTDADRDGWLSCLSELLQANPSGVVLTCSALKRVYRERLRKAAPGLKFVYLEIAPQQALARVTARAQNHFFSSNLVESQFATLEDPTDEPDVLRLDATAGLPQLQDAVLAWFKAKEIS